MRPSPSSSDTPPSVATVLVVDDEQLIRRWLKQSLANFGFQIVEADGPENGIRLLRQMPIDAVIIDVRLSRQRSGLEVLEFVRQDDTLNHLPVIVLTGAALSEDEEDHIRRLGAYVHFKPEGIAAIAEQLHRRLGR